MSSSSSSRRVCRVVLLVALLLLTSCPPAWCTEMMTMSGADAGASGGRPAARRLLVSRPSTSRQKAEQARQQMRVDGRKTPFKQPTANFGRRIPRSGFNPIQNR